MKTRSIPWLPLVVLVTFLISVLPGPVESAEYDDINLEQAFNMLSSDPDTFLLDVRTQGEYENDGHIPGAYLIPHTEVRDRMNELPLNKTTTVIVYCRSGFRSAIAGELLVEFGYSDVKNMEMGFLGWASEGYPVSKGSETGTFPVSQGNSVMFLSLPLVFRIFMHARNRDMP